MIGLLVNVVTTSECLRYSRPSISSNIYACSTFDTLTFIYTRLFSLGHIRLYLYTSQEGVCKFSFKTLALQSASSAIVGIWYTFSSRKKCYRGHRALFNLPQLFNQICIELWANFFVEILFFSALFHDC